MQRSLVRTGLLLMRTACRAARVRTACYLCATSCAAAKPHVFRAPLLPPHSCPCAWHTNRGACLVVQRLAGLAVALLAGAQRALQGRGGPGRGGGTHDQVAGLGRRGRVDEIGCGELCRLAGHAPARQQYGPTPRPTHPTHEVLHSLGHGGAVLHFNKVGGVQETVGARPGREQ